eukprot:CAMPEP_0175854830 /NCGR_PEP_ID=MMETSP0107_2-20121207/27582_1 /TAXON_ID=195067 ORGANISM="Goniomonas pacifica, Strain CCMP1869" /NCGR_SAMPLE_ID=MMETSP0107_2 /ASSEMBLY_ACC=CAM_ASM_000203 /LENGTH=137 /DNA_ID=CAMNT_0017170711 /DNA_START=155 /DNA_END=565 /DNA_ORIENTATION=-
MRNEVEDAVEHDECSPNGEVPAVAVDHDKARGPEPDSEVADTPQSVLLKNGQLHLHGAADGKARTTEGELNYPDEDAHEHSEETIEDATRNNFENASDEQPKNTNDSAPSSVSLKLSLSKLLLDVCAKTATGVSHAW